MFNKISISTCVFLALTMYTCSQKSGQTSSSKKQQGPLMVKWTAQLPDTTKNGLGFDLLKNIQTTTIYDANSETGTYSHHPHITYFDDVIYTMWSNHKIDEDAPGQRVLLRYSRDNGKAWEKSIELFPPLDHVDPASKDGKGRRTQCANGFAIIKNTLYAFSEVWDDGGDARHAGQGRLVRSIQKDGTLGEIFWLRKKPARAISGIPAFPVGDSKLVNEINSFLQLPENELTWDFRYLTTRPKAEDGHQLCEPTPAWQLDNGTWVKIYRDLGKPVSHFNYASFSNDNGKKWSVATKTDFIDGCARANAGVLPDGRVYIVSNIDPDGARDPLAISVSSDGLNFDKVSLIRNNAPEMRYKGRWKAVGFQYPHSLVLGDDLWVIYSVGKEDVQVSKIPISQL